MSGKDSAFKSDIESILQGPCAGRELIAYFERIPLRDSRRALTVLARIYPDKTTVSDEELDFIVFLLSRERWVEQESIPAFVSAIGILNFTESQKQTLIPAVKTQLAALCERCTFELDHLVMRLFPPRELVRYLERLVDGGRRAVLEHILDILWYEDFSDSSVSDETLENLRQAAAREIKRQREA